MVQTVVVVILAFKELFSFQKALCGPLLLKEAEEAEEIQPNETFKLAVNKHHLYALIQYNTIFSILHRV